MDYLTKLIIGFSILLGILGTIILLLFKYRTFNKKEILFDIFAFFITIFGFCFLIFGEFRYKTTNESILMIITFILAIGTIPKLREFFTEKKNPSKQLKEKINTTEIIMIILIIVIILIITSFAYIIINENKIYKQKENLYHKCHDLFYNNENLIFLNIDEFESSCNDVLKHTKGFPLIDKKMIVINKN